MFVVTFSSPIMTQPSEQSDCHFWKQVFSGWLMIWDAVGWAVHLICVVRLGCVISFCGLKKSLTLVVFCHPLAWAQPEQITLYRHALNFCGRLLLVGTSLCLHLVLCLKMAMIKSNTYCFPVIAVQLCKNVEQLWRYVHFVMVWLILTIFLPPLLPSNFTCPPQPTLSILPVCLALFVCLTRLFML